MEFKNREEYIEKAGYMGKDKCPFCSKDLSKINKVIHETKYWYIVYNKYPYFGLEKHILVFPKNHYEFTYEIPKIEFSDLKNVEKFVSEFYDTEEYFSFIRQTKGNKSIEHLHYHYLPGIPSSRTINGEIFLKIKK